MTSTQKLLVSHAAILVLGVLGLCWLALPLADGEWRFASNIRWDWLLVPCLFLAGAAGTLQGLAVGLGRFWPSLLALFPAALPALWWCGTYVAPMLFGPPPVQPEPELMLAALTGWMLFVAASLLITLGVGAVVAKVAAALGRGDDRARATG